MVLKSYHFPEVIVASFLVFFSLRYGLLLTPERDDPLDSALASAYYDDLGTYENVISTHTAKHAMVKKLFFSLFFFLKGTYDFTIG